MLKSTAAFSRLLLIQGSPVPSTIPQYKCSSIPPHWHHPGFQGTMFWSCTNSQELQVLVFNNWLYHMKNLVANSTPTKKNKPPLKLAPPSLPLLSSIPHQWEYWNGASSVLVCIINDLASPWIYPWEHCWDDAVHVAQPINSSQTVLLLWVVGLLLYPQLWA